MDAKINKTNILFFYGYNCLSPHTHPIIFISIFYSDKEKEYNPYISRKLKFKKSHCRKKICLCNYFNIFDPSQRIHWNFDNYVGRLELLR